MLWQLPCPTQPARRCIFPSPPQGSGFCKISPLVLLNYTSQPKLLRQLQRQLPEAQRLCQSSWIPCHLLGTAIFPSPTNGSTKKPLDTPSTANCEAQHASESNVFRHCKKNQGGKRQAQARQPQKSSQLPVSPLWCDPTEKFGVMADNSEIAPTLHDKNSLQNSYHALK